jgi:hypothetical protein
MKAHSWYDHTGQEMITPSIMEMSKLNDRPPNGPSTTNSPLGQALVGRARPGTPLMSQTGLVIKWYAWLCSTNPMTVPTSSARTAITSRLRSSRR